MATTFINGAAIDDTGRMLVTMATPTSTWPFLGGFAYDPVTMALAVIDAVPTAIDPYVNGLRVTPLGQVYVTIIPPNPVFYIGGLPRDGIGRLFFSSDPPTGTAPGGWPIAGNGGIAGSGLTPPVVAGEFFAPFTTSLIPVRAGGNPMPTFTRATAAFAANNEGILRLSEIGEARFQGSRRVENYIRDSQTYNTPNWATNNCTITTGVTGPTGQPDACTATCTAVSGLCRGSGVAFAALGARFRNSIWVRRRTGTGSVELFDSIGGWVAFPNLTTSWQRITTPVVIGATDVQGVVAGIQINTVGDAVDVAYGQCERVDMRANQAPSEYVATNVLAAPWYGAGMDTVKNFATTLGNSVPENLFFYSQDFSPSDWFKGDCTMTVGAQAPDGTATAFTFADNTELGVHTFNQVPLFGFPYPTNQFPANQPYTFSIHLKAGTLTWVQLQCPGGDVVSVWGNFNLVTGVAGNAAAGVASRIVPVGNGWFRCSLTVSPTAQTNGIMGAMSCRTNVSALDDVYVGTGQTMFVWGAQVEKSGTVSPYVPTTTALVYNVVKEGTGLPLTQTTTNLMLQSQAFDSSPTWTPDVGALVITPNAIAAPDGTMTAEMYTDTAVNSTHRTYQFITAKTNAFTTISCHFKAGTASWVQMNYYDGTFNWANFNVATGVIGNYGSNEGSLTPRITALANGWFRCSITFIGHAVGVGGSGNIGLYVMPSDPAIPHYAYVGTGQTVYVWGAQFEEGDRVNPYVATTAAPSYAMLGRVQENAATNLCQQSQTFNSWVTEGASIGVNTTVAPDGTLTAETFTDNTAAGVHRSYISATLAASPTAYTFSVYVKRGTLPWMQLFANDAVVGAWAYFDIDKGVVGSVSAGVTARVQALPNRWFRCSLTHTTTGGTAGLCIIYSALADNPAGDTSHTGASQTMFLWGAQVEANAAPTSYVPTTTAVVTRAEDVLSYAMLNNLSGATATTYSEVHFPYASPQLRIIFRTTGPPVGSPQYVQNAVPNIPTVFAQGANIAAVANPVQIVAVNKIASAYSGTTASICSNGAEAASAPGVAAAPIYPSSGNVVIGSAPDAPGLSVQGTIRNVEFWPTRKTDPELQAMTVVPAPPPNFYAPLVNNSYPLITPTGAFAAPTMTRATTATVTAVPLGGTAMGVVSVVANEMRFWGPQRTGVNAWQNQYGVGTPWISPADLRGYLSEDAAQNRLLQSVSLTTAPWATGNATFTPGQSAPDGTTTAFGVTDNGANTGHSFYQFFNFGAYPHTLSIYAKGSGIPWLQLSMAASGTPYWANFNIITGAVGASSGVTATSVQPLGGGWFRLSITATTAADAGGNLSFILIKSDVPVYNPPYVGISDFMFAWGPQMEAGANLTSYIPTTTAITTRNLDLLEFPVPGNIPSVVGSAYQENYLPIVASSQFQLQTRYKPQLSSPLYYDSIGKVAVIASQTGGFVGTANARNVGAINKSASAWQGTSASVVLNGGAVATGVIADLAYPTTGTMGIGSSGTDGQGVKGTCRNVKFYNVRLTDAQLQGLTT